jgi:V/A-type H+-transporting ATPase subunit A
MLSQVLDLSKMAFDFDNFNDVSMFFKRVINQYKQMNYSEFQSEKFNNFEKELESIIAERKVA